MTTVQTARYSKRPLYLEIPQPSAFQKSINIVGEIPAGFPSEEEEGNQGKLIMDLTSIGIPPTPGAFALRVVGDSMIEAGICNGDFVLLEKRKAKPGDIVVALLENAVTLKRYVVENGKHLLRAENPNYKDIPLNEQSQLQGVAVGIIRKL